RGSASRWWCAAEQRPCRTRTASRSMGAKPSSRRRLSTIRRATVHVLRAPGVRVVATPEAIDAAASQDTGPRGAEFEPLILRFAPDEAFAVGATGVHLDDPEAIIEPELGYT